MKDQDTQMHEARAVTVIQVSTAAPVTMDPRIDLMAWRVIELASGTRHFVGFNVMTMRSRGSTPIVAWDPARREGRTESGRIYHLHGQPSRSAQELAFMVGALTGGSRFEDVSEAYA